MSAKSFWDHCLSTFKESLPAQQYNSWIKPLHFEMDDEKILLSAPNAFTLKLVQERFLADITGMAENYLNATPIIELKVEKTKKINGSSVLTPEVSVPSDPEPVAATQKIARSHSKLNPALSFENFVTGKANQLAHAAAIQVADSLGSIYNPLFVYGGVGLGKTHLLQAIGNHVQEQNPKAKICYVHATNYVSDLVRAVQTKQFDQFKQFYNSLDLLLIDDIQFIADKPGTQQEFFYTLNTLTEAHKQVVITCDTFPKEIHGMEPRLTSRFSWGLTVAIDPPNIEIRVAILLQKAQRSAITLDDSVAFFIAKHVRSNIRELEGALKRVDAYSRFHKRPITVELAKEALKDLLAAQNKQISIENIQKTVADYYRIKPIDLLSKKRTRAIARPRQIAMSLARELTQLSLPEIGAAFGGRDHTTVLHACKTVEELKNLEQTISADFNALIQILRS